MAKSKTPPPVQEIPEERKKTSFSIKADTMRGLNVIAALEDRNLGAIVDQALEEYLSKWESKNGALPKKQG